MPNPRILVLDDDIEFLNGLVSALRRAGFDAIGAADVDSAARILMGHEPKIDVLVVDLVLPGKLSGFDVISAVTRNTPPFKIIAASAVYRDSVLEYICKRLEVDAFVEKSGPGEPLNAAKWLQTVRRVLNLDGAAARA